MEISNFPLCCGARILSGIAPSTWDKRGEEAVKDIVTNLKAKSAENNACNFMVLAAHQRDALKAAPEAGFIKLATFDPAHGGIGPLTLWAKGSGVAPEKDIKKPVTRLKARGRKLVRAIKRTL